VSFSATAEDDCDASPTLALSHASGSSFPIGDTNVTVTATDSTGKVTTGQLTVTVLKKTEAPSSEPSLSTAPSEEPGSFPSSEPSSQVRQLLIMSYLWFKYTTK
jgi:hypothetical protein